MTESKNQNPETNLKGRPESDEKDIAKFIKKHDSKKSTESQW